MHSLIASYTKFNFFMLFYREFTTHKIYRFCIFINLVAIIRDNDTFHVAAVFLKFIIYPPEISF